MKFFLIMVKNLRRNLLRTTLTCLAVMVLVFMVTLIWTVITFLDSITAEKSKDLKAIVTERWQIPSQMPLTYYNDIEPSSTMWAPKNPGDVEARPRNIMSWQFYGGSLDPNKRTIENIVFFFAMDPDKLRSMMDDLQDLDMQLVEKLKAKKDGALIGRERLEKINKRVGERFKLYSMNYKGIDLEFEIVGMLPEGRYNQSAVMNMSYFNDAMDKFNRDNGTPHPMDKKRLNLIWLRMDDLDEFQRITQKIETSELFTAPSVKCETASSGIASFLSAYRDIIRGMRWLLVPALLASMILVIANAISISVRERRTEMAVLKVLGFSPMQILTLVLGEALIVGGGSGLLSAGLTYGLIDYGLGGVKFPIAFFPAFMIPIDALWWGLSIGVFTALLGSVLPAWSARTIKVSEVFSKVA